MKAIKILIVDDEPMIRRTLVRKLQREHYQTGDAEDGTNARRRAAQKYATR